MLALPDGLANLSCCSFVGLALNNDLAVDGVANLGAEELLDELLVGFVVEGEFSLVIVLELRVIDHLLRNALASEEPDGLDVKVGDLSNDGHHGEGVASERVDSLEETVHEVAGLIEDNTLTFVLVVLGVVEAVALVVVVLEEEVNTLGLLDIVGEVNEVGLECHQVELAGREFIEGIDGLNGGGFSICFLLGGSSGSGFLLLLLLGGSNGLLGLGAELDVTESLDDLREGDESLEPGSNVGGNGLSEATVEGNLEGKDEGESNLDISNSESIANEVGLALEVGVEDSDVFLELLD